MPETSQERAAVPMLVLTRQQEHVEAINATLRKAGHAVHCTWLPDARDLPDALIQINPEMLVVFADEGLLEPDALAMLRTRTQPPVPVILVRAQCDEATILDALRHGAQDVVTLANRERLQFVCTRELRAFRMERALNQTLSSARESQKALKQFLDGSADAIAEVQEGIVVDTNRAWSDLYGLTEPDAAHGMPIMEFFHPESHAALKGALVACLQGKWSDHALRVTAVVADGSQLALELQLQHGDWDGEPAVRICVPARRHDDEQMEQRLTEVVQLDPGTGLLHRRHFVEQLRQRLHTTIRGGVRFVALVRPDRFEQIVQQVGPLQAEDLVAQMASLIRDHAQPGDLCGRFTGSGIALLLERGTPRDAETWAENLVKKIGTHVFKVEDRTLTATVTVGLGLVPSSADDPTAPVADAWEAVRKGRDNGGNQVYSVDRADTDTRTQAYDKIWVRHIKAALMENRFRLVQQPIASLLGEDKGMFDVLVRMLDEQGKEVLPSEFIPAAERNDLMKNIDRWVIGASMSFCAARSPSGIFIRLSRDTINDQSLPIWLSNQLKASKVQPARLCFQVDEKIAGQYLLQTQELREQVKRQGFRFAIEHFGAGGDPQQMVERLRPDFVKIDGTLMQGLATAKPQQQRVKALVDIAKEVGAVTIAERVEDANTMAVLWQLGIEFIQGYFVNKPEEVVLG
jgi:diguanylate cyclase (GGDEF)-like protein/PAS domain S-box-containing protein